MGYDMHRPSLIFLCPGVHKRAKRESIVFGEGMRQRNRKFGRATCSSRHIYGEDPLSRKRTSPPLGVLHIDANVGRLGEFNFFFP